MTTVSVIVGSTRDSRFSSAPANWIKHHLEQREGLDVRLLDLRDFDLPFFDSAMLPGFPGRPAYENEHVRRWTEQIATSDAFVVATAEYNFGPPAVLKNALDWVYPEWNRKPVSFVSWGALAGLVPCSNCAKSRPSFRWQRSARRCISRLAQSTPISRARPMKSRRHYRHRTIRQVA
ncbi:NADPH-dependent FMN reductase [Pseudomonas mediterranea]|uniref:NADPH-dependent FMN reductase n=1 Tax=Pseudomonas mediterranea TaxID=183795 RepID=UPI000AF7D2FD|nr:NAD(P)H-dependent oxidoreductase [Pseudomonas mediterranea]